MGAKVDGYISSGSAGTEAVCRWPKTPLPLAVERTWRSADRPFPLRRFAIAEHRRVNR